MHIEPFGPRILEESTLIKRKVKNQQKKERPRLHVAEQLLSKLQRTQDGDAPLVDLISPVFFCLGICGMQKEIAYTLED